MIVWFVLGFIVSQISGFLSILVGIVIWLIVLAFWLVLLIAFVMCLIKAYQKQFFKLPLIGNFAEKFSTK
jgi:uncharacterized membrane protein